MPTTICAGQWLKTRSLTLCDASKPVAGALEELESFARKENIPIIPHETVAYFGPPASLTTKENPLEIGTAIGFSALLMAENAPDAKLPLLIGMKK